MIACEDPKHVYGPVPSRRLGRSLGIDMVPYKTCSYDCLYCQLGRTTCRTIERHTFGKVDDIMKELQIHLTKSEPPDFISLAGSGEPTLNSDMGELIHQIKGLTDIPVAVLTNGSLLWMPDVQEALQSADRVIPSLDAGNEELFQYVNRPHPDISFTKMIEGIRTFVHNYHGELVMEVMLLDGVTGIEPEARKIGEMLEYIGVTKVQLNTVIRPPAEDYAFRVSDEGMLSLKEYFPGYVDVISGKEWQPAGSTASETIEADILSMLQRRPCTFTDVANGFAIHITEALKYLDRLLAKGDIKTVKMREQVFYAPSQQTHRIGSSTHDGVIGESKENIE